MLSPTCCWGWLVVADHSTMITHWTQLCLLLVPTIVVLTTITTFCQGEYNISGSNWIWNFNFLGRISTKMSALWVEIPRRKWQRWKHVPQFSTPTAIYHWRVLTSPIMLPYPENMGSIAVWMLLLSCLQTELCVANCVSKTAILHSWLPLTYLLLIIISFNQGNVRAQTIGNSRCNLTRS